MIKVLSKFVADDSLKLILFFACCFFVFFSEEKKDLTFHARQGYTLNVNSTDDILKLIWLHFRENKS